MPFDRRNIRKWPCAFHSSAALAALAAGVAGLITDSGLDPDQAARVGLHALFGILLSFSVIARFYWGMKDSPLMPPNAIYALTRQLSRSVYLLLYSLLGLKLLLDATHGGTFASAQEFQVYLAYGVFARVIIHVLGVGWHCRAIRRVPG